MYLALEPLSRDGVSLQSNRNERNLTFQDNLESGSGTAQQRRILEGRTLNKDIHLDQDRIVTRYDIFSQIIFMLLDQHFLKCV